MTKSIWIEFADGALRLQAGRIARLVLNQPERHNAMSRAMWAALPAACQAIESDPQIRAVILEGAGGKAFCAGADIGEFGEVYATPDSTSEYNAMVREGQASLRNLMRPTIALVEGICVGGGCGIALACDLRFASERARFGITPAKLGVGYSRHDIAQLIEKVGPARAKDILFSGRLLDADEAMRIGLIDRLAAADEIASVTETYAAALADLSKSSIRSTKTIINGLTDSERPDLLRLDRIAAETFEGEDFREGYRAFLEKRKPDFR